MREAACCLGHPSGSACLRNQSQRASRSSGGHQHRSRFASSTAPHGKTASHGVPRLPNRHSHTRPPAHYTSNPGTSESSSGCVRLPMMRSLLIMMVDDITSRTCRATLKGESFR